VSDTSPSTDNATDHGERSTDDALNEAASVLTNEAAQAALDEAGIEPSDEPTPWLLDAAAGARIDPLDTAPIEVLVDDGTNGQKAEPSIETMRRAALAAGLSDQVVPLDAVPTVRIDPDDRDLQLLARSVEYATAAGYVDAAAYQAAFFRFAIGVQTSAPVSDDDVGDLSLGILFCGPSGFAEVSELSEAFARLDRRIKRTDSGLFHSDHPPATGRSEPDDARDRSPLDLLRDGVLWGSAISSLPVLEWLVDGLLYRDTVAVIFGPSGTAKSLVAQDIGQCVATGFAWQGRAVHQGKVLYVVAEGTSGIRQRHEAWREHHHIAGEVGIGWIPFPVNLMQPDWVDGLVAFAAEVGAVLIVFDTLARSMAGGDENSTKDMSAVVAAVDRVRRECRATPLFVHHSGVVGGRQRGSTVLLAAADTELEVVPTTVPGHIALKVTKQRDGATGAKFPLRLEAVGSGRVVVADDQPPPDAAAGSAALTTAQRTALDSLVAFHDGRPMAAETWREASGLASSTFYRALNDLVRRREVESVEGNHSRPGGYRRVDNGPPPAEASTWE
jgi:AAA domain